MADKRMTPAEIQHAGLAALARELGLDGMIRFLQQFERGHGDYSIERHAWLDRANVASVVDAIRRHRRSKTAERTLDHVL